MRILLTLAALALLAPTAVASVTYLDESRIMGCLVMVQVTTIGASLNCPGIVRTVAAAEAPGASYRLTVTWTAADPAWAQLHADLVSCDGSCNIQPGVAACVNNICAGNPGQGVAVVQQASITTTSPLVLTIPTNGPETNVSLALQAPGPVFASVNGQSVHYTLERVP
jgi:hypothetical protein